MTSGRRILHLYVWTALTLVAFWISLFAFSVIVYVLLDLNGTAFGLMVGATAGALVGSLTSLLRENG